ncbi:MAG TPA: DUF4331 family protein [Gemmatimonadaceae bacterium]|jgi:hypothetical protein
MNQIDFSRRTLRLLTGAATIALAALGAACGNDTRTTEPGFPPLRTFNQVQRLGNPLVSEVFLAKKDHLTHGSIGPVDDVAAFAGTVKGFVAAFRPQATTLQNTLAAVLLPDMLIVQTDKPASSAGWLSWALADGYGGRALTNDVVDIGLSGIFSDLLDTTQAICKPGALPLCTDNVGSHSTFSGSFPYLANPR